jgi:hypothetical protein
LHIKIFRKERFWNIKNNQFFAEKWRLLILGSELLNFIDEKKARVKMIRRAFG